MPRHHFGYRLARTITARPLRWLLPAALLCFCAPRVSLAADANEETDSRRQERQLDMESAITEAAKAADDLKPLETRERVTYEHILADPDNIDLNFRFAKTQVAEGDLVGASATLERILMIRPDLAQIRMFYALVLLRLDNLEDAEREFLALQQVPMAENQRAQIQQYLAAIHRTQRRTHVVATASMGWGYDTNRNAAASSKERLLTDTPLALTGTSQKRPDTNFTVVSGFDVAHELGHHTGHQLIGSFDYYLGEQTVVDDLDLQSFSAEGGAVIHTLFGDVSPTGFCSYLYLSRETYLRSQGVKLRSSTPIGDRLTWIMEGVYTRENYVAITENAAAPERSGNHYATSIEGRYTLSPNVQIATEVAYDNKNAKEDDTQYNAYEGFEVTGTHTWLLGQGQFLLSSLSAGADSYAEPDTSISQRKRRDRQLRARMTYGAPVALLIGEWLPGAMLRNLTATLSLEQYRALSNIKNYNYKNTKVGMLLTKRYEF